MCRGTTSLTAASTGEGPAFVAVGAGGRVLQLHAESGAVQASWLAGSHALTALAAAPANSRLLLSSATVTVWDVAEQKRLFKFSGHSVCPALRPRLGVRRPHQCHLCTYSTLTCPHQFLESRRGTRS